MDKRYICALMAFILSATILVLNYVAFDGSIVRVSVSTSQRDLRKDIESTLGFSLNSCRGLYLDLGTNVGTQIRKLYEQEKFPGAKVLNIFSEYYGAFRENICAIGFEPNPQHDEYLQELETNLKCRKFPVKIFTRMAIHTEDGRMTFYRDTKAPSKYKEWASSLTNWQNNTDPNSIISVETIDLSSFFEKLVMSIPNKDIPILMKMDIEGAEYGVLEKMSSNGQLCKISASFIEWHPRMSFSRVQADKIFELIKLFGEINQCKSRILSLDDESYQTNVTDIPLVACNLEYV